MAFVNLKDGSENRRISNHTVLCLGNFDGVHKGHRALISAVKDEKNRLKSQFSDIMAGAWLFNVSPLHYLQDDFKAITDTNQKLEIFKELSLDFVFLADFKELCSISPADFIHNILEKKCNCVSAVCGYNYHFAKDGAGDAEYLKTNFRGNTIVISPVTINDIAVSSTIIRALIKDGKISEANSLLERPFTISASIEHGFHLGTSLGFPTINQTFHDELIVPHFGVYISKSIIDGKTYNSITNIGIRPTVSGSERINCETFILDFHNNIYGEIVSVQLLEFLRNEHKFEDISALKNQIQDDVLGAKKYFAYEK